MDIEKKVSIEINIYTFLRIIFLILLFLTINKTGNKKNYKKQKNLEDFKDLNTIIQQEIKNNNNYSNYKTNTINNILIEERKEQEINDYRHFLQYKEKPKDPDDNLIIEERKNILTSFNVANELINDININILLDVQFNFGNQLSVFNKLIFYCEMIGCKKILLKKDNNMYINNTIYYKEYNMTIEVIKNDDINDIGCNKTNNCFLIVLYDGNFYYNNFNIKIEDRFWVFKDEILKNLPKIEINENDLYIHIRGGDIFNCTEPDYAPDYAQPPLCFFKKVIQSRDFRKIYIISQDEQNPVINELIKYNANIIFKKNSLAKDIATLAFAYNIVGSISSFLISIIKLNNNLKYFWEYDRYPTSLGIPHLHHSLYNLTRRYTLYKMEPSEKYKNDMIIWENSLYQIKLMFEDICPNNFITCEPKYN